MVKICVHTESCYQIKRRDENLADIKRWKEEEENEKFFLLITFKRKLSHSNLDLTCHCFIDMHHGNFFFLFKKMKLNSTISSSLLFYIILNFFYLTNDISPSSLFHFFSFWHFTCMLIQTDIFILINTKRQSLALKYYYFFAPSHSYILMSARESSKRKNIDKQRKINSLT